ncbi:MarR family winged helix-turn-helix transcriptional regulator [Subtercola boreus]|uniref:MarR family winged helix-turn-helix transcriptional regulator n=1 Tax=Subtercola boreus TaxID=120213 RepID=UPI001B85F165|nr:MarR family transcriptional regulator [Subtercola boreus]
MGDITSSQKSVLSRLENGPATKSDLARAESISPQSMGVIITSLEAAGLVIGSPDETDGRKTLYLLSGTAMERYSSGRLAKDDWLFRAIAEQLSANEERLLEECLPLLRRLAQGL